MSGIADTTVEKKRKRGRRSIRLSTYLKFLGFFTVFVFGIHAAYLQMPYYWDEAGQFIPSAWDIHDSGRLVPVSATPNVHPPGVMVWVAGFWKVFGEHLVVARCAMLLLGALLLAAAFLLAVELCGSVPGLPAFFATLALALSPLVYTQSLLVQLDLSAAAFTCLVLYYFLSERHWQALAAASLLVLVKETGVLLPLTLCVWLTFEKRYRRAAYYLIPAAVLGVWLLYLHRQTGAWLGNTEFGRYNLLWTLRLSHIGFSLARRFYFLFIGNFHWIGTLGILAGLSAGLFRRRRWAVAATFAGLHIVMVSVLGGAVLERYMVPVLPLFYAAALVGFTAWTVNRKWLAYMAMLAGLVAGLFFNPLFWPFPFENNLAMVTFTRLHAKAAERLESEYAGARVATIWPMSAELGNPRLGYVKTPFQVVELRSFTAAALKETDPKSYDLLVRFSRDWDPDQNLLRNRAFRWAARQTIGFEDPVTGDELETTFKMKLVHLYQEDGQWVEVYQK